MNRSPWVSHFGFSRTPFTKSIAAKDLYRRAAHDEAVARIGFLVAASGRGGIVGEGGRGNTGAGPAAVAALVAPRPHLVYSPHPPLVSPTRSVAALPAP